MKKMIAIMIGLTMLFSVTAAFAEKAEPADAFSDINGHWAKDTINKWKDKGVIAGYPDGSFQPDNPVTRAELAKILALAFDLQKDGAAAYADIDTAAWYNPYLERAARYIPVYPLPVGYETNLPYQKNSEKGENGFLPSEAAIRMHAAEALVKIRQEREKTEVQLPDINDIQLALLQTFKDADYEELFAMHGRTPDNVRRMFEYTWLANELDVMKGNADGYFMPYGRITRAEILTAIDRMP